MTIFNSIKFLAIVFSLVAVFILFSVLLGSSAALIIVLCALSLLFWPVYGLVLLVKRIMEIKRGGR